MIGEQENGQNGQSGRMPSCNHDPDQMSELIQLTRDNGKKLDEGNQLTGELVTQYQNIIKWLLAVVCVIALGKSALETVQSVTGLVGKAQAQGK